MKAPDPATARRWEELALSRGGKVTRCQGGPAEAAAASGPPKGSKFKNKPTVYRNVTYHSRREAEYAKALDDDLRLGRIAGWARQVPFTLGAPDYIYRSDFVAWNHDTTSHAVDIKGATTQRFRDVVRLWREWGPIPLHVVYRDRVEVIEGRKAGRSR